MTTNNLKQETSNKQQATSPPGEKRSCRHFSRGKPATRNQHPATSPNNQLTSNKIVAKPRKILKFAIIVMHITVMKVAIITIS